MSKSKNGDKENMKSIKIKGMVMQPKTLKIRHSKWLKELKKISMAL